MRTSRKAAALLVRTSWQAATTCAGGMLAVQGRGSGTPLASICRAYSKVLTVMT